ncbi:MAG: glycosyltransferase family 39 protein, partial [Patescibacteria group bacterium]
MKKIILIIILVLATVLRLYKLSAYPVGLNADEAALGYNAYSLLLTGKDEHGHSWPVNLESFGDFKPAGYAYLLIPFIKVFGLTEFAVRLPSAIFGVLAVLFIYLLTKEIYLSSNPSPESGEGNARGEVPALLSALMLAISPWHLHFSRGAWEVNVATTLILIGLWLFIKKRLAFCVLTFALSMYIYQSARLIAPVLGLGLLFFYRPKKIIPSFLLLLLLLFPLGLSIIRSDAASRFSGVGLLADEGPLNRVKELRGQHTAWNSVFSRILHNRPVSYALAFAKNYLDHFTSDFL